MNRKRKTAESIEAYHRNLKKEQAVIDKKLKGKYLWMTGARQKNGVNIPATRWDIERR